MTSLPSPAPAAYSAEIDELGFAVIPDVISNDEIATIIAELCRLPAGRSLRRGQVYAARNLLTLPLIASLAGAAKLRSLCESVIGGNPFPVRAILFDKVPGANWPVGWHQDRVIPVAARKEAPGFTAWSVKDGIVHVQPPVSVLTQMLSLRIHLDNCKIDNGPLKVIAGSHKHGLLDAEQIQQVVAGSEPTVCEVKRGAVLAMRPLSLHASSRATKPSHRRVIHIEYAAEPLPSGLEWPRWN